MTFDIEMQGIIIGAIQIRFYSLMILSGMLAGIVLARNEAQRLGEPPSHVVNIAALGATLGLVGARLYHVFDQQNWAYYQANPEQILAVWNGGIGIFGAVVGAIAALWIYARWNRLSALRWLDIGAPAFLLGQAIGRWGNFFNQELFGGPSNLPWAIPIGPANRPAPYQEVELFHPLFLYESLLSLLGVAVLLYLARRFGARTGDAQAGGASIWRLLPGDVTLLYFIWYPAERFALEFLRITPWTAGGIPMAQWISGALVLGAAGLLAWRHLRLRPGRNGDADLASRRSRAAVRRQRRRLGAGSEADAEAAQSSDSAPG